MAPPPRPTSPPGSRPRPSAESGVHEPLPPDLAVAVARAVGDPVRRTRLAGVGPGGAELCEGPGGRVVAKLPAGAVERALYRDLGPSLAEAGVRLPGLLGHGEDGGGWLLLEHVPDEVEWQAAGAEADALAQLAALHQAGQGGRLDGLWPAFRFAWTRRMNVAAAESLPPPARAASLTRLETLRATARHLFAPACLVHGDPNRTNWRREASRLPVLVDWERAGYGHPAVDLGIFLPGLPHRERAEEAAVAYLRLRTDLRPGSWRGLGHSLLLVKAWSCAEFLWQGQRHPDHPGVRAASAFLRERLPAWLDGLDAVAEEA